MTHESLSTRGWDEFVGRLGGVSALMAGARETKAFLRARGGVSTVLSICPVSVFGYFELTDKKGGETLDRIPVVPGEIRRSRHTQPDG